MVAVVVVVVRAAFIVAVPPVVAVVLGLVFDDIGTAVLPEAFVSPARALWDGSSSEPVLF